MTKIYWLYWQDGEIEKATGESIKDAFSNLGYSQGATKELDFFSIGLEPEYIYCKVQHRYVTRLIEGKIPKGKFCPYANICETYNSGKCFQDLAFNKTEFSCGLARAFELVNK